MDKPDLSTILHHIALETINIEINIEPWAEQRTGKQWRVRGLLTLKYLTLHHRTEI